MKWLLASMHAATAVTLYDSLVMIASFILRMNPAPDDLSPNYTRAFVTSTHVSAP